MKGSPVNAWMPRTLLCVTALLLCGCSQHLRLNNAQRLMDRPGFTEAAQAAPEWVEEALTTVNELEHELERR